MHVIHTHMVWWLCSTVKTPDAVLDDFSILHHHFHSSFPFHLLLPNFPLILLYFNNSSSNHSFSLSCLLITPPFHFNFLWFLSHFLLSLCLSLFCFSSFYHLLPSPFYPNPYFFLLLFFSNSSTYFPSLSFCHSYSNFICCLLLRLITIRSIFRALLRSNMDRLYRGRTSSFVRGQVDFHSLYN